MVKKLWATKEIYDIVANIIKNREASGISRDDTLQMLLDSADDKLVIIGVSRRGFLRVSARMLIPTSSLLWD
jgi:hypothetical protein